MRNFLATSFFALALFVGATGAAPVAHAAVCSVSTLGQSCDPGNGSAGICRQSPDDGSYGCGPVVTNTAPGTYGAQAVDAQTKAAAAKTATNNGKTEDDAYNGIMIKIMSLFAWLLGVAAITLDNAVYYTVVTMGKFVQSLSAVGVTWRILRDIGNIMLIFGFLAIGISIILNTEKLGYGKKMLPMLLIAAVFLNFSLFITSAVIDTGNLFATQFYTQINGGNPAGVKSFDAGSLSVSNEGISNKIMNQLGLQTIYGDASVNKDIFKGGNPWFIGFMGIILFMTAAFVFFSLAFILIARFVILLFLIILSPIGFAGLAVPQLASTAKSWWDTLFEQTITAPVLLLMLYVALAVITDVNFLTGFGSKPNWTGFATGNLDGFASMMISFIVAMGLLLAVIIFSKKLSAFGAGHATALASKLTFGATAYGMRYTAGLASNAVARKVRESKTINSTAVGRLAGRRIAGALDYGATASYHVGAGLAAAGVGVDFGKTHQGGYRAEKKVTEEYKKSSEDAQKEKVKRDRIKEINDAKGRLDAGEMTQDEYNDTVTQHMAKLSSKELEDLDGIKKGTEDLVKNLSPQQFETLMKSDNLSAAQKGGLRDARFKEVNAKISVATASGATQTQIDEGQAAIAKMSTKELAHMDKNVLTSDFAADHMTNDQYDSLVKEGILNTAQKTAIDVRRKNRFDSTVTPPADVASAIKSMKWNRDQIKKLPPATLTDVNVLNALGADALNLIDIARTGNLSPTDRKKLGVYFEDIATHPTDPRQADFAAYLAADPRIKRDLLIT